MDRETYYYIKSQPDLHRFIRYHPIWYRYLSRDPDMIVKLEKEAKKFYGKTFNQKINRFYNNVQMFEMLLHLMKDNNN